LHIAGLDLVGIPERVVVRDHAAADERDDVDILMVVKRKPVTGGEFVVIPDEERLHRQVGRVGPSVDGKVVARLQPSDIGSRKCGIRAVVDHVRRWFVAAHERPTARRAMLGRLR